ncbi:hypothetical protein [Enterococcus termitis]|uniref:Bacteriocin n=1 Tax=Enterococcus termitis TaxID=332950 RepID=A0A1E5GYB3_9ENTE|nr:hypothetical protein [Enterococcus termitis]OEG17622.1 hypothetical protein BCR25_18090 [Enterococcus termitis]OJG96556.1 hypothetical protein RV18_GL002128 [Enterococcus termitis]
MKKIIFLTLGLGITIATSAFSFTQVHADESTDTLKSLILPSNLSSGFIATDSDGNIVDYSNPNLLTAEQPAIQNPLSRATVSINRGKWSYSANVVWGGKRGYSGVQHPLPHASKSKLGSSVGYDKQRGANVWSNAYSFGNLNNTHYASYDYGMHLK